MTKGVYLRTKPNHNKGKFKSPLGHCRSRVERHCETCGAVFFREVRSVVRGKARYCSPRCDPQRQPREPRIQKYRRYHLKGLYGMTLDEYEILVVKQNGKCAICGEKSLSRRLDVDHDHKTGTVRGLLCSNCNRGIGWLQDNPALIEAALRYLRSEVVGK